MHIIHSRMTNVSMRLLQTALTQHPSAAARLDKTNLPSARYFSRGRVQTRGTGFAQNLPARWTLLTQHRNRYAAALTVYDVLNTSVSIGVSRQLTLNWRGLGVVWIYSQQVKEYICVWSASTCSTFPLLHLNGDLL